MEIINKKKEEKKIVERKKGANIFLGGALISCGILWLLYNYGVISECFFDVFFSWEMLITVIGIFLLSVKNWVAGGITTGVGAVLLITDLLCVHVSVPKLILPSLVIIAGIGVLIGLIQKK